jgi:hypothetical protein
MTKRICVCGGRDYINRARVFQSLDTALRILGDVEIIHGGARGADSLADEWARDRGVKVQVFAADWNTHHNAAGPIRNRQMLKHGFDMLVAFPGGKGTQDMIDITMKAGVAVYQIFN